MIDLNQAAKAAARRSLVFALPQHDTTAERHADSLEARKLLEQAACLAVRAGRNDVATDALALLERLEARA